MNWTHPTKSLWLCPEHPDLKIRRTKHLGWRGFRYRAQRGELWLGTAFSLGEAKLLARSS